jgi:hypothetical protein
MSAYVVNWKDKEITSPHPDFLITTKEKFVVYVTITSWYKNLTGESVENQIMWQ